MIDPLGMQLGVARKKGLLSDKPQWPWCIFINDLRIVSELIASPSEFVLFVQRRLATNLTPYAAHDELDLLCKFFDDGLYDVPAELKGAHRIALHGYTDRLDQWYVGRAHGAVVEKPGRKIPVGARSLMQALEATGHPGRTRAALWLAELAQDGLDTIDDFVRRKRAQTISSGERHDAGLIFRGPPVRGITIYVSREGGATSREVDHVHFRMVLTGAQEWLAIFIRAADMRTEFRFFDRVERTPCLASRVERWQRERRAEYIARCVLRAFNGHIWTCPGCSQKPYASPAEAHRAFGEENAMIPSHSSRHDGLYLDTT